MKLKNILIITIAIVTLGLVVACSDDVVVTNKDNNQDYTQVLTSNGAFEYNGTKYDTLQLALKAIADGKGTPDVKTIKVLRDVTGPGASISADEKIVLDLDGHTLTFIDVEKEALTAGGSVELTVKNGTLAFFRDSAKYSLDYDRTLILSNEAESLSLEGVTLNAVGQNAVVAVDTGVVVKGGSVLSGDVLVTDGPLSITGNSTLDGALNADDSHVSLGINDSDTSKITGEINLKGSANGKTTFTTKQSTIVTGKVTATGQHTASETVKDVALDIKNTIDSLTMDYSYINIPSPGHVTVENDMGESGNYYVAEEGYSAVTLPAGSAVVVNSGLCVVVTESMVSYYGSISEALADNKYAGATIKLLKEDTQGIDENLSIGYSVDINLNGYNLNTTNGSSITLADGVTLTVFNNNGSNVTGATFKATVTSDSNGTSNFVVGKSDDTAKIEVTGEVHVTGSFTAAKAILDSAVSAGGALTSGYGAEFKSTVSAASVTDGVVPSNDVAEVAGSTFHRNVTATGALSFYKAKFTKDENSDAPSVTSTNGGDITIIYASGVAGNITTTVTPVGTGSITINNGDVTSGSYTTFTTGDVIADGNVNITGKNFANEPLEITGSVRGQRIEATMTRFGSKVSQNTLTGSTISLTYANFLGSSGYLPYSIEATGIDPGENTSALYVNAIGCVSSLKTSGGGSIKVDNSSWSSDFGFTVTGEVTASKTENDTTTYYDVELIGNSKADNITVNGTIKGNDISLTQTKVNDSITAYDFGTDIGSVIAENSTFDTNDVPDKKVSGSILNISTSTFAATTSGTASNFYALEASGADYVKETVAHSALEITTSTGSVASLTANGGGSIKVDNSEAGDTLTVTGNVSASKTANSTTTYYDVTLIGKNDGSKNVIVNGTIDGNDIYLTNATVNGNVNAKDVADDATTDVDETDNGSITATHSTFTPSTGSNKELKGNTISVSNSTFNATGSYYYALEANGADPDENKSALTIATTTGSVASLTATAGSINVANSDATSALTVTGDVTAKASDADTYFNINLVGHTSTYNVAVGGNVSGLNVNINTASVTGTVTAEANLVSKSSEFNGKVTVAGTITDGEGSGTDQAPYKNGSTFKNDVEVTTEGTFKKSTFTPSSSEKKVTGNTLSFAAVTFTDQDNVYAIKASGADDDGTAIDIDTSIGKVASLTATAGSINVDNGDAGAALLVNGAVIAFNNDTEYYDVTLTGPDALKTVSVGSIYANDIVTSFVGVSGVVSGYDNTADTAKLTSNNSVFNGNVTVPEVEDGTDLIYGSAFNSSVYASTKFSAKNGATVGDNAAADVLHSPVIEISNSNINLNRLAASETESAKTVTITNPSVSSVITTLKADTLSVTDNTVTDNKNYLTVKNASITGINTNSVIAGGIYEALSFTGNAISELVITKGIFTTTGDNNYQFLNGRTRVRGTYLVETYTEAALATAANYSVQMVGIDRMDADFVVECAHITSADLTNVSNIVAKINQSLSSQYIYIDYQPSTIVAISSAPEYKFSTTGYIYTGNVTLNFGYTLADSTGNSPETDGYTLTKALIVTGESAPYFNFGDNRVKVTGRVFVTYQAVLYSTLKQDDFVTLATDLTSAPVWIVSLPGELEGGRYKYKAKSVTLGANEALAAKERILIGPSAPGTMNDDAGSSSWKSYYNNATSSSIFVYSGKNIEYFKAEHHSDSSYKTQAPTMAAMTYDWASQSLRMLWKISGGSGHIIWSSSKTGSDYNGYNGSTWTTDVPDSGEYYNSYYNGKF